MFKTVKNLFWSIPGLSSEEKEKIFFAVRRMVKQDNGSLDKDRIEEVLLRYRDQVLSIPTMRAKGYCELNAVPFARQENDVKLFAFYLTQFMPTPENDAWWGKGVTEWNNVCRAVPEFVGHYQPRLPGELGFYDLRLKENMVRQAELAKLYGVFGFCFYYYWFDGRRLLDKPLDLFVRSKDIDLPFCLCWANESWKSSFSGSSAETILLEQRHTVESYKNVITDLVKYLVDNRYYTIDGKKVILVYKPQDMPKSKEVLTYWREYCQKHGYGEIYLIGVWMSFEPYNVLEMGFDAVVEFQPGSLTEYVRSQEINDRLDFVGEDYTAQIYSYKDLVEQEVYRKNFTKDRLIHSVFPSWDNTARRNNHGALIFHESEPALYKKWLKDVILDNRERTDIDDNVAFLNSWNEWGEGSYIEPDKYWGYAYLQANREAIEECRKVGFTGSEKHMIDKKMISIIILNYNDSDTVMEFYARIKDYQSIDHIIIVDNQSPDGSFSRLRPLASGRVDVIQTDSNKGYSYGNNFGAKFAAEKYGTDILFISNPDVEFQESFLYQVVRDMMAHQAQAATGYMQLPNPYVMNRRINTYWREVLNCTWLLQRLFPFRGETVQPGEGIIQVEWLPGSLFAIESDAYQKIHGLDDNIFLYYEEQVLGKKFLDAGYKMILDTDIAYQHNESVSIDKSIDTINKLRQLYRSKYYFYSQYEHIGPAKKILMRAAIRYGLMKRKVRYRLVG